MGSRIRLEMDITPTWWQEHATGAAGAAGELRRIRCTEHLITSGITLGYAVHELRMSAPALIIVLGAPEDVVDLGALIDKLCLSAEGVQ